MLELRKQTPKRGWPGAVGLAAVRDDRESESSILCLYLIVQRRSCLTTQAQGPGARYATIATAAPPAGFAAAHD